MGFIIALRLKIIKDFFVVKKRIFLDFGKRMELLGNLTKIAFFLGGYIDKRWLV